MMRVVQVLPLSRQRNRCLAARVKVRLLTHEELEITAPVVRVKAGVVLLRGRVSTRRQKLLAADVAARVRGVVGVFNELTVAGQAQRSAGKRNGLQLPEKE